MYTYIYMYMLHTHAYACIYKSRRLSLELRVGRCWARRRSSPATDDGDQRGAPAGRGARASTPPLAGRVVRRRGFVSFVAGLTTARTASNAAVDPADVDCAHVALAVPRQWLSYGLCPWSAIGLRINCQSPGQRQNGRLQ